jgi:demethyllactenocin mycarosyltransferase
MAHVAFLSIPYAGHINPTLAVGAELVARGHRVTYPVPEEFRPRVEETGARAIGYHAGIAGFDTATPFEDDGRFATGDFARFLEFLLRHAVAQLAAWAGAFTPDRPDLVVHDVSCWAGRLLAARWGVPAIRSQPVLDSRGDWWADRGYLHIDPHDARVAQLSRAVDRLAKRVGADLTVARLLADEEQPALVFMPREFQYGGDSFDARTHFVGPCLGDRRFQGTWSPPAGAGPLVLVALGTVHNRQPDFYRNCLAAFAGAPWHAVITTGPGVDPVRLGPIPHNVDVRARVPQLEVLRSVDVFVNHGGMGSIMESLASGVPVIAVPQTAEQRANADRIVELGLGLRLAMPDARPEALRSAVAAVLADGGIRARVAGVRAAIRAAGGATAAADVVETLLASCDPDPPGPDPDREVRPHG